MRPHARALLLSGLLLLVAGAPGGAKEPSRTPAGPAVTVHDPAARRLELALDEAELHWPPASGPAKGSPAPAAGAIEVPGARVIQREGARAVFALTGARGPGDVQQMAVALERVNPGAEARLVLYEPGSPRTEATRWLLTGEVALLLDPAASPAAAVAGTAAGAIRPVPGVPGGFVVEATDHLAALDLADALRGRAGVRQAYPLLLRQYAPR